jgi:hypothetical protein
MSKPMLVTWPFVLLLLDFWPLQRIARFRVKTPKPSALPSAGPTLRHLIFEKLPFFALAIASSVITFIAQRGSDTMSPVSYLPISDRIGNALVSCVRYLGKMFWPEQLAFFYPYHAWADWQVAGAGALLVVITLTAVWQMRRRPFLLVGWLWFLGTLVPVIGLVQVGLQAMADRYSYIPLIGPFVMIVWSGKEFGGRGPGAKFICGAVMAAALAACLVVTSRQLRYWRNSETVCRHALGVTFQNVMVHFLLGEALTEEGKFDEGAAELKAALQVTPWYPMQMTMWYGEIHCDLGLNSARQGKIQEAIDHYREAIRNNPDEPQALNNLAWLLATSQDSRFRNGAEAVELAERACAVTHHQMTVCIGTLAAAYAEAGRYDDAVKTAESAIASATTLGQKQLVEKNRWLLELYRAGRPYHETTKL